MTRPDISCWFGQCWGSIWLVWFEVIAFPSLALQMAQSRSQSFTLGPAVCIKNLLGAYKVCQAAKRTLCSAPQNLDQGKFPKYISGFLQTRNSGVLQKVAAVGIAALCLFVLWCWKVLQRDEALSQARFQSLGLAVRIYVSVDRATDSLSVESCLPFSHTSMRLSHATLGEAPETLTSIRPRFYPL